MAKQILELESILMTLQSVFGTPETSLVSTDFIEPLSPEFAYDAEVTPVDIVGAGFSQAVSVVGQQRGTAKLGFPMRYGGEADNSGDLSMAFQSCGWAEALATNEFTWTPSDDSSVWKDATVWGYGGNIASGSSLLHKFGNLMFNGKITLDFMTGMSMLEIDGVGLFDAGPTDASQPTDFVRNDAVTRAVKNGSISILGDSDYVPLTMEFDFRQDITPCVALNTSGVGPVQISKRKINWTAKVYADLAATTAPVTSMINQSTGVISVAWGSAPQVFGVNITEGQIESVSRSEQNGVRTWDLAGTVINNGMNVTLDTSP